jgi:uncharacterized membrane protein YheB (UPF0754 family)
MLQELLLYASIPVVSAIVGWGTNVLALKMTFWPVEFVGVFPPWLGWQGIIPSKARKMANTTVDLITTRLVGVEEVFARLDADLVLDAMRPQIDAMLREIIHKVVSDHSPEVWAMMPEALREEIFKKAAADAEGVVRDSFEQLTDEIEEILDLKRMAVDALMADKAFINTIFLECGREEFRFIERSGITFGFLFGLLQMAVWFFYKEAWVLPAMGLLVGWATNFLALRLIFSPLRPIRLPGVVIQGLFLKRQDEVSEAYARLITEKIVNTENIMEAIFQGPTTDRIVEIIDAQVRESVESYAGLNAPIFNLVVGSERYATIKQRVTDLIVEGAPKGPVRAVLPYAEEAMDLEATLRTRLQALSPPDFVGLLRPIFQEDEYKLIAVGAVLGALVGAAQGFVLWG